MLKGYRRWLSALFVPIILLAVTACPGIIIDHIQISYDQDIGYNSALGTFTCISPLIDDVVIYRWSFGDGSSAEGQTVTHSYALAGTFQVECQVLTSTSVLTFTKQLTIYPVVAFVANVGDITVSVIDTTTQTVIDVVPAPAMFNGIALDAGTQPVSNYVYVANAVADTVSVIDTRTNTVIKTIDVGDQPGTLVISPDSKLVYVANFGSDSVSVIDIETNMVIATIPVGDQPAGITFGVVTDP